MKTSERNLLTSLARRDDLSPAEQGELTRLHQLALGTYPADDINDLPKPAPAAAPAPLAPQLAALAKRLEVAEKFIADSARETSARLDGLNKALKAVTDDNAQLRQSLKAQSAQQGQ